MKEPSEWWWLWETGPYKALATESEYLFGGIGPYADFDLAFYEWAKDTDCSGHGFASMADDPSLDKLYNDFKKQYNLE